MGSLLRGAMTEPLPQKKRDDERTVQRRKLLERLGIGLLLVAIVWPFFIAPSKLLYIRYFDAETYFDPIGKLVRTFAPWDTAQHLGFNAARAVMYFSIQSLLYAAFGFLGPNVLVRATAVATLALTFFAARAYVRDVVPDLPWYGALLAAFFYATNPYVIGLVHDGYFPLLTQYILLPIALLACRNGERRDRPEIVVAIALLFTITSLYTVPLIAMDAVVILALHWRFIFNAIRRHRTTQVGLALVFALNFFWLVPVIIGLTFPSVAFQDNETAGDIAMTAQYGTLTSVLLLRSNPGFWTYAYGSPECTSCHFYFTAPYIVAMLAIVTVAIHALYLRRQFRLLVILGLALALMTSTHYVGELIGTPYEILTSLPLGKSLFRGAVKFGSIAALIYTVGVAWFFVEIARIPRLRRIGIAVAIAVLVSAWPLVSGGIIERGKRTSDLAELAPYSVALDEHPPKSVVEFPNFTVDIPPAYRKLSARVADVPRDEAIFIAPNASFAAYAWGAYGNDFVSTLLHHDSLESNYLGEPNPFVGPMLADLGDPAFDPTSAAAVLRSLRIGRTIVREDALGATGPTAAAYGRVIVRDASIDIRAPRLNPIGMVERASRSIQTFGNAEGLARYAAFSGSIVRTLDPTPCPDNDPIGYADFTSTNVVAVYIPTSCNRDVDVRVQLRGKLLRVTTAPARGTACLALSNVPNVRYFGHDGETVSTIRGRVYRGGTCLYILFRGNFESALLSDSRVEQKTFGATTLPDRERWPGVRVIDPSDRDAVVTINVPHDPTFVGFAFTRGKATHVVPTFVSYGYANGFRVASGERLVVVQVLTLGMQFGAVVSLLALAGLIAWYVRVRRNRRAV